MSLFWVLDLLEMPMKLPFSVWIQTSGETGVADDPFISHRHVTGNRAVEQAVSPKGRHLGFKMQSLRIPNLEGKRVGEVGGKKTID